MTVAPQIVVVEIPPGPVEPGPTLSTCEAFQLRPGTRVVLRSDGVESPAAFHGMEWTDAGYLAYIVLDEPLDGRGWALAPAWYLKLEDKTNA